MASKNMTTIMSLYVTFNLVLLGFASAQSSVAQPLVCPIDVLRLEVCLDFLGNITGILNQQGLDQCCTLLTNVGRPSAAVCLCNAARGRIPILSGINISVSVNGLLNRCRLPPQSGLVTCN